MAKNAEEVKEVIDTKKGNNTYLKLDKNELKTGSGGNNIKLSLNELKKELNDLGLFYGFLVYTGLQRQYEDMPDEEFMSLEDFKTKMDEFLKKPIYKEKEV